MRQTQPKYIITFTAEMPWILKWTERFLMFGIKKQELGLEWKRWFRMKFEEEFPSFEYLTLEDTVEGFELSYGVELTNKFKLNTGIIRTSCPWTIICTWSIFWLFDDLQYRDYLIILSFSSLQLFSVVAVKNLLASAKFGLYN